MRVQPVLINSPLSTQPLSGIVTAPEPVCLKLYQSLLKDRQIGVYVNPSDNSLYGVVYQIGPNGDVATLADALPLRGVPRALLSRADKLQRFFQQTHLIAEKGVDGIIRSISVRVSGNGGATALIPFQPGLSLGSVVRGEEIKAMENYAKIKSEQETAEQQIKSAEQRMETIEAKIDARVRSIEARPNHPNQADPEKDSLIKLWRREKEAVDTFMTGIIERMFEVEEPRIPLFAGFHAGVVSPIDSSSIVDVQPKGFDSLQFTSEYVNMEDESSVLSDTMKHDSRSNTIGATANVWVFNAKASAEWSKAASERLASIKKSGAAKGVLVLQAMSTTRHVRCYRKLEYSQDGLQAIANAMSSDNPDKLKEYGITLTPDKKKEIYILTEAVLGGSFTAFVVFRQETESERIAELELNERRIAGGLEGGGTVAGYGGSIGFAHASHKADQTENDELKNIATTRVSIEIISQGAMPGLSRETMEHEIIKHLDLNPSNFQLSREEAEEAKSLIGQDQEKRSEVVARRQMRMENAGVAVLHTVRGLTSERRTQTLHTAKSVLSAYDDFTVKMTGDVNAGIPVGFHYQILTQEMVNEKLAKMKKRAAQ